MDFVWCRGTNPSLIQRDDYHFNNLGQSGPSLVQSFPESLCPSKIKFTSALLPDKSCLVSVSSSDFRSDCSHLLGSLWLCLLNVPHDDQFVPGTLLGYALSMSFIDFYWGLSGRNFLKGAYLATLSKIQPLHIIYPSVTLFDCFHCTYCMDNIKTLNN